MRAGVEQMLPLLRELLFRIARGRLASLFIGAAFEHASALMPLQRVYDDRFSVIFHHPRPSWKTHLLAVPKRRIPSFAGLRLQDPGIELVVLSLFEGLQRVLVARNLQDAQVMVNGGAYQDVPQIHFHVARDTVAGKRSGQCASSQPPRSLIAEYQDAVAFVHPDPTREVHVVLTTRSGVPPLQAWDPHQSVQRQGLLNMLVLAQQVVATLALDRYTLVVHDGPCEPGGRLTFQIVSGSTKDPRQG